MSRTKFANLVIDEISKFLDNGMSVKIAELAELVDALDSGSSVCKDFRVQVPGSASKSLIEKLSTRKVDNPNFWTSLLEISG
jgi:hypothetical protein